MKIIRFLHETSQGFTNLERKLVAGTFLDYALIAEGIWKGDILVADIEELGNMDASEIHPRRIIAGEVPSPQRREDFILADGTARLSGRRPRIPRTHSKTGTDRKERRSQWRAARQTGRVSTDRINR